MHVAISAPRHQRAGRRRAVVRVGPADDGRSMSLKRFSRAEVVPGYLYELASGVIEVSDLPDITHHRTVRQLNKAITAYDLAHPGVIMSVGGGGEAKIEMPRRQSERPPDISIYLTPPPEGVDQPWDQWIPDIVIEVVSATSAKRDYEVKPSDYHAAGVREYWIIDPRTRSGLFLVRRADSWSEHKLGARGKWRSSLLPGFTLDLSRSARASKRPLAHATHSDGYASRTPTWPECLRRRPARGEPGSFSYLR